MRQSGRQKPRDLQRVAVDGARLRALRIGRGWSQLQLACEAGAATSTIGSLESGRLATVRLRTAARIAGALGVELGQVLGDERIDKSRAFD